MKIFFKIFFVFLYFFLILNQVWAETSQMTNFVSTKYQIMVSYPSYYKKIDDLSELANGIPLVMAARYNSTTFNIIANSGSYDFAQPLADQAETIVKSYRSVGLTDATSHSPKLIKLKNKPAFCVEMHYTSNTKPIVSLVCILPANTRHFILTFVTTDPKQNEQSAKDLLTILDNTILPENNSKDDLPAINKTSEQKNSNEITTSKGQIEIIKEKDATQPNKSPYKNIYFLGFIAILLIIAITSGNKKSS